MNWYFNNIKANYKVVGSFLQEDYGNAKEVLFEKPALCEEKDFDCSLQFNTGHEPALDAFENLCKRFPNERIEFVYGNWCSYGKAHNENGKFIEYEYKLDDLSEKGGDDNNNDLSLDDMPFYD